MINRKNQISNDYKVLDGVCVLVAVTVLVGLGVLVVVPVGVVVFVGLIVGVGVTVVLVGVLVIVGVLVTKVIVGVLVIVGVGGKVVVYITWPTSQESESIILTKKDTPEYGDGTVNVNGNSKTVWTNTQLALRESQ